MQTDENGNRYHYDWLGGPVYRQAPLVGGLTAQALAAALRPYVIDAHIADRQDGAQEVRTYFALTLAQAIARSAELQLRLREMGFDVTITNIRNASRYEIDAFFRAIDSLETRMPDSAEAVLDLW